ncbi:MAG: glycosyltransferase family 2 protein [Armatimonadota bacterium]
MLHEIRHGGLPVISVITVCFNEPLEKIRDTFSSIILQTYQNIEWIVVDGGSGDETLAVMLEYNERISCLISEPDDGIYDAMNKGIKHATGEFINFMNVGDRYHSDLTLAEVVSAINACPRYDCYYGDVVRVDANFETKELKHQMKRPSKFLLYSMPICHQTAFSSRQLYDVVGLFNLKYRIMADWHWILRSIANGAQWQHIDVIICDFDSAGISSNLKSMRIEYKKILVEHFSFLERLVYPLLWKFIRFFKRIRG